ncbi:hypothetical protein ACB092_11G184500 [Castanea dentata]
MVGSSPHQAGPHWAESAGSQRQDDFLNLESERDRERERYREGSMHTRTVQKETEADLPNRRRPSRDASATDRRGRRRQSECERTSDAGAVQSSELKSLTDEIDVDAPPEFERIRLALARMIVIDELSFKFVEHQGFQEFMEIVEPRKAFVGQRVCVTTDTWTSIQNLNYMVVTVHFIDGDWTYQKKILNFCPIANHKGGTIGRTIESCLLKWGIDRLFTFTADNASSNDVAIDYVKKKTKEKDSSILGGEFMHMRCCAHTLNLIVQSGLKSIHESIAKVRNAVRYVRASPARFEKFQECVENEKIKAKCLLSLDVPTRWNSTYLMLDCALKFENVKTFVKFLGIFYEATLRFSGSLFVTSNTYFHELISIEDQLQQLCSVDGDPLLKSMAVEMKKKYDKYWGSIDNINLMLFVAVVLDPRYRLKYVNFLFREWYGKEKGDAMSSKVRDALKRLYVERVGQNGASSSSGNGASLSRDSMPSVGNASLSDRIKIYNNRFKQHLANEDGVESKSELDRYLLESSKDPNKMNSSRYRVLYQIACDVLAILVSTVASESAFSTGGGGGHVLDSFHNSLSPNTVEALICTQNWLKDAKKKRPIKLRECMDNWTFH